MRRLLPVLILLAGAGGALAVESERIVVEADAAGCPSRAEVVGALEGRIPGATVGAEAAPASPRVVVDHPDDGAGVRLRYLDASGAVGLERRLTLQQGGGRASGRASGSCAALAEAAAQVVSRYLREIGYRPPAAQPPPEVPAATVEPPPVVAKPLPAPAAAASEGWGQWLLAGGVGGRVGVASGDRWTRAELTLGLELRRRWLSVAIAGGASEEVAVRVGGPSPDAVLLLRAYPLRVAAGVVLPTLYGITLTPALGASFDWVTFRGIAVDDARAGGRWDPALEAGLGVGRRFGRLALSLRFAAGWSLAPRDFMDEQAAPVFRTPGGYLRGQLEAALLFGKDS